MARIIKTVDLHVAPRDAWDALSDFAHPHTRAFPGVLTAATCDGDVRTVTFANGLVAREELIDRDEAARRLVYTASGGSLTHHNASFQVLEHDGGSRVVWTLDLLPNEAAPTIEGLMDAGCAAMKATLER